MDESGDERAVAGIRQALSDAVRRLDAGGARDEALATFIPRHRRMLITREAVLKPVGRVWRLGVLLLTREPEPALLATGAITRARAPGRPVYQSVSAEERRAFRAAAVRGRFTDGETVNFDAVPIVLEAPTLRASTGPLMLRDGRILVKWSPTADGTVEFATYLADRVALLLLPPQGA